MNERISIDPKVLVGKPVVKGTRLGVEFLNGLLAAGWTREQILESYPELEMADIDAVVRYSKEEPN